MARKKESPEFLVLFGDTHIGSDIGLWPEGICNDKGAELPPSPFQRWLMECWNIAWDEKVPAITGGAAYSVVMMGDVIEGLHHRTTELMHPGIEVQYEAAFNVLGEVSRRADKIWMIEGTDVHTKRAEATIGASIGAQENPSVPGVHSFGRR